MTASAGILNELSISKWMVKVRWIDKWREEGIGKKIDHKLSSLLPNVTVKPGQRRNVEDASFLQKLSSLYKTN